MTKSMEDNPLEVFRDHFRTMQIDCFDYDETSLEARFSFSWGTAHRFVISDDGKEIAISLFIAENLESHDLPIIQALSALSEERIDIGSDERLYWTTYFCRDLIESDEDAEAVVNFAIREVYLAEILLDLFRKEGAVPNIASFIGFGQDVQIADA